MHKKTEMGMQEAKVTCIPGILLRMERRKQQRGQKEVCYGICVPSYLSKIEHGTVKPDNKILAELFARLDILYTEDMELLADCGKKIELYFEKLHYQLDTKELYAELKQQTGILDYSYLTIEWLLIQAFEGEDVIGSLAELTKGMTGRQRAYYLILCYYNMPHRKESLERCKEAHQILGNSFSLLALGEAYLMCGDYAKIHQMENRLTAIALEEGNTYRLADYYYLKGTAYGCLNMDELMMDCYERSMHLLQNTGWRNQLDDLYYNIGSTYISLKRYEEALFYLNKVEENRMQLHKKAITLIRMGNVEEGKIFLEKMKKELLREAQQNEADWLRYEEACMECEPHFLENQSYLELLERLVQALRKEYHFGHLYFYKDVIIEAYKCQRKYKKALEFSEEISLEAVKSGT